MADHDVLDRLKAALLDRRICVMQSSILKYPAAPFALPLQSFHSEHRLQILSRHFSITSHMHHLKTGVLFRLAALTIFCISP